MIDWMKRLFGTTPSSSTAKERLRLVLMTDHLALAPEIIENMKRDLVDVISRYVQVDTQKVEVNFEREDRALAMLANIPIVAVNRPTGGIREETEAPAADAIETVEEAAAEETVAETASMSGAPPRRKRRKKSSNGPKPAAAH